MNAAAILHQRGSVVTRRIVLMTLLTLLLPSLLWTAYAAHSAWRDYPVDLKRPAAEYRLKLGAFTIQSDEVGHRVTSPAESFNFILVFELEVQEESRGSVWPVRDIEFTLRIRSSTNGTGFNGETSEWSEVRSQFRQHIASIVLPEGESLIERHLQTIRSDLTKVPFKDGAVHCTTSGPQASYRTALMSAAAGGAVVLALGIVTLLIGYRVWYGSRS